MNLYLKNFPYGVHRGPGETGTRMGPRKQVSNTSAAHSSSPILGSGQEYSGVSCFAGISDVGSQVNVDNVRVA